MRFGTIDEEPANRNRMRLSPQPFRNAQRMYPDLDPPCSFVPASMNFTMVPATQRNGEFITHLFPECTALCESKVVSVGRLPPTNDTSMLRNESDVFSIPDPTGF